MFSKHLRIAFLLGLCLGLMSCQYYVQRVIHADGSEVLSFATQLPFADVDAGVFNAKQTWREDGSGEMLTGATVNQASTSDGLNFFTQQIGTFALAGIGLYLQNPQAFNDLIKPRPTPVPGPENIAETPPPRSSDSSAPANTSEIPEVN